MSFGEFFIHKADDAQQHVPESGGRIFFAKLVAELSAWPEELLKSIHLHSFPHYTFIVDAQFQKSRVNVFALPQLLNRLFCLAAVSGYVLEIGSSGYEPFRSDCSPERLHILLSLSDDLVHAIVVTQLQPNIGQSQCTIKVETIFL